MSSKQFKIFFAALLMLLSTGVFAKSTVVVLWDGASYRIVRDMYRAGELPNLKALGALGQMTSSIICMPTGAQPCMAGMTRDQYSTLLTGVFADKHLIWGLTSVGPIPPGLTIYEKLRAAKPGIKLGHWQRGSLYEQFTNMRKVLDVFVANGTYPPATINNQLKAWGTAGNDFFAFVGSWDPDHTGHNFGVNSPEYRRAIRELDVNLGNLVASVPKDTAIYVVGDHSMGLMDETTGVCDPKAHSNRSATTVPTILVQRGATYPQFSYMHQLEPIWRDYMLKPKAPQVCLSVLHETDDSVVQR
jgi:predicted AlkP superfamily pyrophosphatase or phosphodiesterase